VTDLRAPDGSLLFHHRELACKATDEVVLAPGFTDHLVALRLAWARPMIVNSCCRSSKHNIAVGGHERSLHVYDSPHWPTRGACAIDFKVSSPQEAMELMLCAADLGWSVGVPKGGFLHLDRRETGGLKPNALFGYGG
jgi:hypothetical protein